VLMAMGMAGLAAVAATTRRRMMRQER
jgi:hypothetical protein